MSPSDALALPGPGWSLAGALRKYLNIYRVSLIERLTYRGDFFLGSILRFLPMVTTILLWSAVYQGASDGQPLDETRLGDQATFTYREMVAYLLLVHVSRMFSSMPGLAGGVARDIREGVIKKYLVQPLDMLGYLVSYRAAHKTAYIATSALPYACLFAACFTFFDGFPDWPTFTGYVVSLLLGFVIGFFFEMCMGMLGFWFLEINSFLWVVNTLNFFVSGHMFPLDLLGSTWASVLKALPFQYLAYFPAAVFLGKVQGWALVQGLLVELGWAGVLVVVARLLYRRGLRHYSAFGG